jgi:eukaryotic-like serine/threonine-protein kinase
VFIDFKMPRDCADKTCADHWCATSGWRRWVLAVLTAILSVVTVIVAVQALQPRSVTLPGGKQFTNPDRRAKYQVALVDRNGGRKTIGFLPDSFNNPRISPDGKEVALDGEKSIWIAELSNISSPRRLTTGGNQTSWPIWNGDGTRIVFTSDRDGGARALFSMRADGAGEAELLVKPARAPEFWPSATSKWFSYTTVKGGEGNDFDIWTYSLAEKKATPVIEATPSAQLGSRFSPDLHWLAYQSNEMDPASGRGQLGQFQVYVEPFPRTGARFQITKRGGNRPLWSPEGKELFYDDGERLFSVAVRTRPTFTFGEPVGLPISGFVQVALRRNYDLMPDGKQFLMMFRAAP